MQRRMEHEEMVGWDRRGEFALSSILDGLVRRWDAWTTCRAGCMVRCWGLEARREREKNDVESSRMRYRRFFPEAIWPASRPIPPPPGQFAWLRSLVTGYKQCRGGT